MRYLPLIRLAYTLILRPALKTFVHKTDNDVDDHLIDIIDRALLVKLKDNKY